MARPRRIEGSAAYAMLPPGLFAIIRDRFVAKAWCAWRVQISGLAARGQLPSAIRLTLLGLPLCATDPANENKKVFAYLNRSSRTTAARVCVRSLTSCSTIIRLVIAPLLLRTLARIIGILDGSA